MWEMNARMSRSYCRARDARIGGKNNTKKDLVVTPENVQPKQSLIIKIRFDHHQTRHCHLEGRLIQPLQGSCVGGRLDCVAKEEARPEGT